MPGIAEFLAEGSDKLIVAELHDGDVMLTMVNTITHERHSITMRRTAAHDAGNRSRVPVPTLSGRSLMRLRFGARRRKADFQFLSACLSS
jgi:hypothetical protein